VVCVVIGFGLTIMGRNICSFVLINNCDVLHSHFLIDMALFQITENNTQGGVSVQLDQQQVLAFLQGNYIISYSGLHTEVSISFDDWVLRHIPVTLS